jgi:hypothetical protein
MIKDPADYAYTIPIWPVEEEIFQEMYEWLTLNIRPDKWTLTFGKICFVERSDATLFRLKFAI